MARCEERINDALAKRIEEDDNEQKRAAAVGEPVPETPSADAAASSSQPIPFRIPSSTQRPDDLVDPYVHVPDHLVERDGMNEQADEPVEVEQPSMDVDVVDGMPNRSTTHRWRISGKTSASGINASSTMGSSPMYSPMGSSPVLMTCGDIISSGPTASERSGVRWLVPPDEASRGEILLFLPELEPRDEHIGSRAQASRYRDGDGEARSPNP